MEPRRVGGPKFRVFFPSPATIFIPFFLLLGVFSLNFGYEALGPSNVHVWSSRSGCGVKPRPKAAGVSHDSPRAQTCTFEGPGLHNTTKIQREDPQRGKKQMKIVEGEGKKERNFGRSSGGRSGGGRSGGGRSGGGRSSGGRSGGRRSSGGRSWGGRSCEGGRWKGGLWEEVLVRGVLGRRVFGKGVLGQAVLGRVVLVRECPVFCGRGGGVRAIPTMARHRNGPKY